MRSIVESCLRFRLLVVALAAEMMFSGIKGLRDVPVDVFPEFEMQHVPDLKFMGLHFFRRACAMSSSYRVA